MLGSKFSKKMQNSTFSQKVGRIQSFLKMPDSMESKDGLKLYVYLLFSVTVIVIDGEIGELLLDVEEVGREEASWDVRQG